MSQIKRKIPIHNILLQTLVLFAFLSTSICGCNGDNDTPESKAIVESDFSGKWKGQTMTDDPAPVDLTSESKGDEIVYTLHYGGTYASQLIANQGILKGSTLTLSIDKTTGKCDILWPGNVILMMRDEKNHMIATIQPKVEDEAKLEKAKDLSEELKAELKKL